MDISRRVHARIPCDKPIDLFRIGTPDTPIGSGRLLNISVTGAMIACDYDLKSRAAYRLKVSDSPSPRELPFHLVRIAPRGKKYRQLGHYGIVFDVSTEEAKTLNALVDAIRSQPSSDDDNPLDRLSRGYWSG